MASVSLVLACKWAAKSQICGAERAGCARAKYHNGISLNHVEDLGNGLRGKGRGREEIMLLPKLLKSDADCRPDLKLLQEKHTLEQVMSPWHFRRLWCPRSPWRLRPLWHLHLRVLLKPVRRWDLAQQKRPRQGPSHELRLVRSTDGSAP